MYLAVYVFNMSLGKVR